MNDDKTSHAAKPATQTPDTTSSVHRILVADDEDSVRQVIAETLIRHGYQVDAAEDGAVAWNILQLRNYDLLVTDNSMPGVSGLDLVRKLRSARMALPVILVSGLMPTEELNRHPGLQLSATLAKPFTGEQLVATVDSALRATSNRGPITPPQSNGRNQPSVGGLEL